MEKKKYYNIFISGDGAKDGYLFLTEEEAMIIAKAMDSNNWIHLEDEDPMGVRFDPHASMTEAEMETDYANRYSWRNNIKKPKERRCRNCKNRHYEYGFEIETCAGYEMYFSGEEEEDLAYDCPNYEEGTPDCLFL